VSLGRFWGGKGVFAGINAPVLNLVNWMFKGDFGGASRLRERRQHGRAAQDAGREPALQERDSVGGGGGSSRERPLKFSSVSGMTNECFSRGAEGKVSPTWLCGPRAGFGNCTGTAGLCSSRLGGFWGEAFRAGVVLLIMITPKVTSIMMGSRKAQIYSAKY